MDREPGARGCGLGRAFPDVEALTAALIGAGAGQIVFEKGAVAAIRCGSQLTAGACELVWLATASLLRC